MKTTSAHPHPGTRRRSWNTRFRIAAALAIAAGLSGAAHAQEALKKQEILFPEIANRTVDAAPFVVGVRATSGLPVALELVTGPAVLEKATLRLIGQPGLVVLRATQPGNDHFQPAHPVEQHFTVLPRPTAPAFDSPPPPAFARIGDALELSVRVSGEPAPFLQWRKDGVPITGANQSSLSIPAASLSDSGYYDVVARNASGTAASAKARVFIEKRRQTISFDVAPMLVPGQPVELRATATSGLPVRFEVAAGPGTLSGTQLSCLGGTVVVRATQDGDTTFDPALPVTQTVVFGILSGQRVP